MARKAETFGCAVSLLLLAAGRGARFGGPKQFERYGPGRHSLMEYVISDGLRHAIGKVVCVIRKGQLAAAEEVLSGAWEHLPVEFIFQSGEDGPNGVPIPSAIAHSPGTAHAVFAARDAIGGPFVVANGDDLYGPAAWDALLDAVGAGCGRPTVATYQLGATLSGSGPVNRALCVLDGDNVLELKELRGVARAKDGKIYGGGDGPLEPTLPTAMNFFYFDGDFFGPLAADGEKFFSRWSGGEWGLPGAVSRLIGKKMISMGAAAVGGPWCGVTYGSDGPAVERAIGETYGAAPLWRNA